MNKKAIMKFESVKDKKKIPYGGEKREGQSFFYYLKRFRNYLLFMLAYFAPSNKLRVILNRWKGVNIANGAYIGLMVSIDNMYPEYIYIDKYASINSGSMIVAHFNPNFRYRKILQAEVKPVIIEEGAIVAIRSIILPGVKVGKYAIVSASSVVSDSIEPYTLVRGNPAIKIAKYNSKMINESFS